MSQVISLSHIFKLIADTRHCHNIRGICWVRFELGPQTTDEDMKIFSFLPVLDAPELVQEVGMCEHLVHIKNEFLQKIVSRWG